MKLKMVIDQNTYFDHPIRQTRDDRLQSCVQYCTEGRMYGSLRNLYHRTSSEIPSPLPQSNFIIYTETIFQIFCEVSR